MSLWMWPPPAGPISSVYCAGVNFHFSLSIFREERDEVWFIQEIAPAATPDERFVWVWAGYHHLFSEWQWRKSKKKSAFDRQTVNPFKFFLLVLYKFFNPPFMSNKMGKIASFATYCIEIVDATVLILNVKHKTSWMNWIDPNPRGSRVFSTPGSRE